jgi:hypothetical protein
MPGTIGTWTPYRVAHAISQQPETRKKAALSIIMKAMIDPAHIPETPSEVNVFPKDLEVTLKTHHEIVRYLLNRPASILSAWSEIHS